jgi:hypothetical protein
MLYRYLKLHGVSRSRTVPFGGPQVRASRRQKRELQARKFGGTVPRSIRFGLAGERYIGPLVWRRGMLRVHQKNPRAEVQSRQRNAAGRRKPPLLFVWCAPRGMHAARVRSRFSSVKIQLPVPADRPPGKTKGRRQ